MKATLWLSVNVLAKRSKGSLWRLVFLRFRIVIEVSKNRSQYFQFNLDPTVSFKFFNKSEASVKMSSTSIENLPVEMIRELFEHLPPKALVACSMVNKLWHSIYVSFKVQRLVAIEYDSYGLFELSCVPRKWSYPDRRIEPKEQCSLAIFDHLAEKPLLSNLKHLHVSGHSSKFYFGDLNLFSQLVHLELYIDDLDQVRGEITWSIDLNLPKLKVLVFHCFNWGGPLWIDCPLLSTLVYPEEYKSYLKVNQPETIRKLQTNMVDPKWLARFENVECLVTEKFEAISLATLLSLPKLKDLRYIRNIGEHIPTTVDRLKRTLSEFVDEAKRLRGRDFRVTFAGFQLTNVDIDEIDFGVYFDQSGKERMDTEYVYMKNYHLIEPNALHFVELVRYNSLMSYVTEEFPRCFFEKFTGIEEVKVYGVVKDPNHLLWFLKSLRFLKIFELESTGLSQEFYDQLPAAASSLIGLEFRGDWTNEVQVNFNFLNEFSSLLFLVFKQALSFESAISLARSSANLVYLLLKVRLKADYSLSAEKERDSTAFKIFKAFKISKPTQTIFQTIFQAENPDEIVDYLEGLEDSFAQTDQELREFLDLFIKKVFYYH